MNCSKLFLIAWLLLSGAVVRADEALQEITVSPGDTLWSISNKYLKDPQKWSEIVRVNNLSNSDPTLALPGTRIRIPVLLLKEEFRTAQLIHMESDVRYKHKNDSDFKPASANMILKYEDSVRTMQGGQARVKFPTQEVIQINENSLVVLKPEKILQEVQLMQGTVKAKKAKVIMPSGAVVNPQNKNSEYQAKVREDQSEVVFVYKGEVNVTAQGKTVHVKEEFGTHVPKASAPLEPVPLKNLQDFNPADMASIPTAKVKTAAAPAVITPTSANQDGNSIGKAKSVVSKNMLASYHVQLSKDDQFRSIVLDKTDTTGSGFNIRTQPIPDGTYYMRVAFLDALGTQAPYSEPSTVIKDTVPPALSVSSPHDGASFGGTDSTCDVNGRVQGAVSISINRDVVFISPNGQFSGIVHLHEGQNEIRISAKDGAENETVVVRKVNYRAKS